MLGLEDARLTKRLLAAGDPSLEKALDICRAEELAVEQQRRMEETTRSVDVAAVGIESDDEAIEGTLAAIQSQPSQPYKCGRCGGKHAPRKCPAWGKTCQKCQLPNHFARVCKSKRVNVLAMAPEETSSKVEEKGSSADVATQPTQPPQQAQARDVPEPAGTVCTLGQLQSVQQTGAVWRVSLMTNI